MCVEHKYLNVGWVWKPLEPTIYIYLKVVWEHKYMTKYHKICYNFLAPLYEFISFMRTPCMNDKELEIIRRIWGLVLVGE
jgi:hypothetical protein